MLLHSKIFYFWNTFSVNFFSCILIYRAYNLAFFIFLIKSRRILKKIAYTCFNQNIGHRWPQFFPIFWLPYNFGEKK